MTGSLRGLLLTVVVTCSLLVGAAVARPARAADFRDSWSVPPGFSLTIDSSGYELPTAIAFVRHPGPGPKSPLYFVTELRGTIKVVTRDRTVYPFADLGLRKPRASYPALGAQNGSAAICLDDARGYVFVTYAAFDRTGVLRNGLVRFSSPAGTFGRKATGRKDLGRIFAPYPTSANHQIGGCVVAGKTLFIGVGDGAASSRAQNLDELSGKIVRMTLDGAPAPGNPFAGEPGPRRYVWAYGLRNPFGLTMVGDRLFATQNGNSIDSFLLVRRGENFGWDGTDASIAANAQAVMIPAVAPVHVAYYSGGGLFPSGYARRFFFASAESSAERGAGVWSLGYDVAKELVVKPPTSFVRYRDASGGEVAALALGPDGLYFAPLLPHATTTATVYKLTYDPAAKYPHVLEATEDGSILFEQLGCRSCHSLNGVGGSVGPALDKPGLVDRISQRLSSDEYRRRVEQLDRLSTEPFRSTRDARHAVLASSGDDQVVLWIQNRILEPKFDDPNAAMPKVGATRQQAAAVATYLVRGETNLVGGGEPPRSFGTRVRDALKSKKFAGGVVIGFGAASLLFGALSLLRRRRA
jgi:Glucose / Sorbosone dehydrogenase/Cytochrome c